MDDTTTVTTNAINWKAAIIAGIVAGLIFLMLEMILVPLIGGGSAW